MTQEWSRRRVLALAAGSLAATALMREVGAGQVASPVAPPDSSAQGFTSLRVRQLAEASLRAEVNDLVTTEFVPDVQSLPGYAGYLLGDVLEDERQSLSVVVLEAAAQAQAFVDIAETFVAGLDPAYAVETPTATEGDILLVAGSESSQATPVEGAGAGSYVAVRIYASLPGTDARDFVPLAREGFVPIVSGIAGFQGYLLTLAKGGFMSISIFDAEESARESTAAGTAWAAENLAAFTAGDPQVITATGVYVDLPVLSRGQPSIPRA